MGKNGETLAVTTRVSGRASPTLGGPRSGARTGVCAVCPSLVRTGHAAFLALPDLDLHLQSLGLLRGTTEFLTPGCSAQLNFAENGGATRLCGRNQSLDALDFAEMGA